MGVVCAFAFFFAVLLFFSRLELQLSQSWYMADSSYYYSILLSSQGERPYTDFQPRYTPGLFYLNAVIFNLFGTRMSFVRWGVAAFWFMDLVGLYLVARFFMPRKFAAVSPILGLLWGPLDFGVPWASWYSIPPAIFSLFFMLKYIESGRDRNLLWAGIAAGISFFFKQSTGAFTMIFLAVAYIFCGGASLKSRAPAATESKAVLALRILGVISGCFIFPLLLMWNYAGPTRDKLFNLAPLASLGVFLIALIARGHRKEKVEAAGYANFWRFLAPPALAGATFLGVTLLWFPAAAAGIGAVDLIKYLLMLKRPDFVFVGSALDLTPSASAQTFAPVFFFLSLSLMGGILLMRARLWLRLLLAAGLVAIEVAALIIRPAFAEYLFARLSETSAWMVFTLHFGVLAYLAAKAFSRKRAAGQFRNLSPLIAVLIFCDFFFLQLFPLNSPIHLRWATNAWFVLAAWAAYAFYKRLPSIEAGKVKTTLHKCVRYAFAVVPISLYFAFGALFMFLPRAFNIGFFLQLNKPDQFRSESLVSLIKARPRVHVIFRPKKLVRPALERVDVKLPERFAGALEEVVKYIEERTRPNDFVFGPNLNFINFATGRPSPLSENYFFPGWVNRREEVEMMKLVDLTQPRYVIFFAGDDSTDVMGYARFRIYYPYMAKYLESSYVVEKTIGPFTISRRQ